MTSRSVGWVKTNILFAYMINYYYDYVLHRYYVSKILIKNLVSNNIKVFYRDILISNHNVIIIIFPKIIKSFIHSYYILLKHQRWGTHRGNSQ